MPKRLYGNNELDDDGDGGDDRDDAERAGERAGVTTHQSAEVASDGAPVSRNYPCECPSCIGYNSVLPNLFPADNMSARTSTLGRWSTRQRQRPALPEAELGWQIQEK